MLGAAGSAMQAKPSGGAAADEDQRGEPGERNTNNLLSSEHFASFKVHEVEQGAGGALDRLISVLGLPLWRVRNQMLHVQSSPKAFENDMVAHLSPNHLESNRARSA